MAFIARGLLHFTAAAALHKPGKAFASPPGLSPSRDRAYQRREHFRDTHPLPPLLPPPADAGHSPGSPDRRALRPRRRYSRAEDPCSPSPVPRWRKRAPSLFRTDPAGITSSPDDSSLCSRPFHDCPGRTRAFLSHKILSQEIENDQRIVTMKGQMRNSVNCPNSVWDFSIKRTLLQSL